MSENSNNLDAQNILAKAVAAVAGDLNIARRNWLAYPSNHPVVEVSLQKLLTSLCSLLQHQSTVQIGITRDGLLLGEEFVEKGSIVCRTIAVVFFERAVGTVRILQEPQPEELKALLRLMIMKREDIQAGGGIEKLWDASGITFMKVRSMRYDRFSGTEETTITATGQDLDEVRTDSMWERFVRQMMQGEVGLCGTDEAGDVRPDVLAAALNARFAQRSSEGSGLSSNTIRNSLDVMREMLTEKTAITSSAEYYSDTSAELPSPKTALQVFIEALDPVLRRHILDGFCETADDTDSSAAEQFFRQLGMAMMQETYATAEEYSAAPPLLQGILRKLLPHMTGTYETATHQDEVRDKVRTLLQEHRQEAYVPEDYLLGLKDLLTENSLPQIEKKELQKLLASITPAAIEIRGSEIIMQLVLTDPDGENIQELIQNLADMCGFFLQMGDYDQVLRLLRQAADSRLAPHLRTALREVFTRPEFLNEILSGLTIWGKPKYDQIIQLIRVIGRPFIDPLLDRLAVEENMSLRRFIMERVLACGDAAIVPLVARLSDQRWFVLRNIIIMLRTLAPGQEADRLRPLLKNANQKVRHEVVISLLLAGDPIAQRQLLRDLHSNDRETQLAATHLVDKASSIEIAKKLAEILLSGGFSAGEYELKAACVKALAEIGKPEILPELVKVLKLLSLLGYKTLVRLKVDVVRSLEQYPAEAVLPHLERLSTGGDAVAAQAIESLRNVRSRQS